MYSWKQHVRILKNHHRALLSNQSGRETIGQLTLQLCVPDAVAPVVGEGHGLEAVEEGVVVQAVHLLAERVLMGEGGIGHCVLACDFYGS